MADYWFVKEHRANGDHAVSVNSREEDAKTDAEHLNRIYQTDTYFVEKYQRRVDA